MRSMRVLLVAFVVMLLPLTGHAAELRGHLSLRGFTAAANALQVHARRGDDAQTTVASVGKDYRYRFLSLRAGKYVVHVSIATGKTTQRSNSVPIYLQKNTTADLVLFRMKSGEYQLRQR